MEGIVGGAKRDWCDEAGDLIEDRGGLGGHGRSETPMTDIAKELVLSGRNPDALLNQCKIFERGIVLAYAELDRLRGR